MPVPGTTCTGTGGVSAAAYCGRGRIAIPVKKVPDIRGDSTALRVVGFFKCSAVVAKDEDEVVEVDNEEEQDVCSATTNSFKK
mmetsp:Transcript_20924/g.24080  ORF Transcript_20924/g.24080 Transcript_20924/m.24080 type:complete len:83 (-) Transcript_20924:39-287(-)